MTNFSSLSIGYRIEKSDDLSVLHTFVIPLNRKYKIVLKIENSTIKGIENREQKNNFRNHVLWNT